MVHGVLLINKTKGGTSHSIVAALRRIIKQKEIGHAGTLDPMAEGLILILLGYGTKLSDYLLMNDKRYRFMFRFGIVTDTLDKTGKIISQRKVQLDQKDIEQVLGNSLGKLSLPVPLVSAVKIKGKKLYEYKRENQPVTPPLREMTFYNLEIKNIHPSPEDRPSREARHSGLDPESRHSQEEHHSREARHSQEDRHSGLDPESHHSQEEHHSREARHSGLDPESRHSQEDRHSGLDPESHPSQEEHHSREARHSGLDPESRHSRVGGNPSVEVELSCSKGSYIRSWVSFVGEEAGTGACLEELIRVHSTPFHVEKALTVQEVEERLNGEEISLETISKKLYPAFIPFSKALPHIEPVCITKQDEKQLRQGQISKNIKLTLQDRQKEVNKSKKIQTIRAMSHNNEQMLALLKLQPFLSPQFLRVFPSGLS